MSRIPLEQLRRWILAELDDEWRSVQHFCKVFRLGGADWYRVAVILERLVSDGDAEVRGKRGSGRRWFRRAA